MSSVESLDRMIEELGADLAPVRRLRPPAVRAALWLGFMAILSGIMAYFADLPGIAHRLMVTPDMWLAVLGSTLTAGLGAVSAFQLSVPGRGPWWALLPVPSLVTWVAASGMGCLRTWIIPDTHEASMDETRVCFSFIAAVSIPLSMLMVLLIRRAYPLHPNLTAAVGGLAIAAGAATLLNFFHPYDASVTDLAIHLIAISIVVALNQLFTRRGLGPLTPRLLRFGLARRITG